MSADVELALFGPEPTAGRPTPPAAAGLRPTRQYVGDELCEHLVDGTPTLLRAIEAARTCGLAVSLVLPAVGPGTWPRVRALLAEVGTAAPGTEVVANDWGVLREAARNERLVPVMGRALNRTLRDPRLADALGPAAPAAALDALGGGPWSSGAFTRLRQRLRVARLELDVPPIAIAARCFPPDLPLSIWVPDGVVAVGRVCLPAAVHRPAGPGRFLPGPCRRECQTAHWALDAPAADNGPFVLSQRGNAVLYAHDEGLAARACRMLEELPVDRVVWQTAYLQTAHLQTVHLGAPS